MYRFNHHFHSISHEFQKGSDPCEDGLSNLLPTTIGGLGGPRIRLFKSMGVRSALARPSKSGTIFHFHVSEPESN